MPKGNQPDRSPNLVDSQDNVVGKVFSITVTGDDNVVHDPGSTFSSSVTSVIAEISSDIGRLYVVVGLTESRWLRGVVESKIFHTSNDCSGTPYVELFESEGFTPFMPTVTGALDFNTSSNIDTVFAVTSGTNGVTLDTFSLQVPLLSGGVVITDCIPSSQEDIFVFPLTPASDLSNFVPPFNVE